MQTHPLPASLRAPGPTGARLRVGRDAGWTLIELMIVISLIVVIATIALVSYRTAITRSQEAVLKEDLFRMRDAIDQYYADKATYPSSLDALVTDGYLRSVPEDPFTKSSSTWQTILADFDPANPAAQGIYDVKSGYEGVSLDGSSYSEW